MTRLAARRADGLLLEVCRYVPDLEKQIAMFRVTAEKAGKDPDAPETGALVVTCVAEHDEDLDVVRRGVAFYIHRFTEEEAARRGLDPEAFHEIKRIYARHAEEGGRVMYGNEPAAYEAAPHVTPAMLQAFGVVGTPEECARQFEKYVAAGVSLPILMPLGCAAEDVIEVGRAFLSGSRHHR